MHGPLQDSVRPEEEIKDPFVLEFLDLCGPPTPETLRGGVPIKIRNCAVFDAHMCAVLGARQQKLRPFDDLSVGIELSATVDGAKARGLQAELVQALRDLVLEGRLRVVTRDAGAHRTRKTPRLER